MKSYTGPFAERYRALQEMQDRANADSLGAKAVRKKAEAATLFAEAAELRRSADQFLYGSTATSSGSMTSSAKHSSKDAVPEKRFLIRPRIGGL